MERTEFYGRLVEAIPLLRRYASWFSADRAAAEDLVQETLLKALYSRSLYRQDNNLAGWLGTIMRNTYLNTHQREQRYTHPEEEVMCSDNSYCDSTIEYKELSRMIEQLPADLRTPLSLHITGYKYDEIAQKLTLPLGTVKSRIHTARERLKKQLER